MYEVNIEYNTTKGFIDKTKGIISIEELKEHKDDSIVIILKTYNNKVEHIIDKLVKDNISIAIRFVEYDSCISLKEKLRNKYPCRNISVNNLVADRQYRESSNLVEYLLADNKKYGNITWIVDDYFKSKLEEDVKNKETLKFKINKEEKRGC